MWNIIYRSYLQINTFIAELGYLQVFNNRFIKKFKQANLPLYGLWVFLVFMLRLWKLCILKLILASKETSSYHYLLCASWLKINFLKDIVI